MNEETAYRHGYECGLNGSNLTNCNFKIFSTPENTKEWERGKRDAEKAKQESLATKQRKHYDNLQTN